MFASLLASYAYTYIANFESLMILESNLIEFCKIKLQIFGTVVFLR